MPYHVGHANVQPTHNYISPCTWIPSIPLLSPLLQPLSPVAATSTADVFSIAIASATTTGEATKGERESFAEVGYLGSKKKKKDSHTYLTIYWQKV